MKSLRYITVIAMFLGVMSCQNTAKPNYEYMPNMYESIGYETYQESDAFKNGVEAQMPAEGSIARNQPLPFQIENSNEGYELAKATLKNPLTPSDINYEDGKELYDIYCGICHGTKGNGKGKLVDREKILGVPSYDDVGRAITTGSIYHVIYYGKNTMGSYANQLSENERWQVVAYVEKLKADLQK